MERVRKIVHKNKEIIVIDYVGFKGDTLVDILEEAKELILKENKKSLILSITTPNTYASSKYLRHLESNFHKAKPFIHKQAVVGLSQIQAWIVQGINLWMEPKLYTFESIENAIDYLADD